MLLSAPGVGKSDVVSQAAVEAGLPCRSLLGTQIAPEGVGGIPRIVGERSVFCPPRVLLPEEVNAFLKGLNPEERAAVLLGNVARWGELGADDAILATLKEITGIEWRCVVLKTRPVGNKAVALNE
ncbi:MAG: hypothetical protein IJ991_03470 [Thermoguttaceae bacterium]|nr:hypothetical protein [Thermoguttaceae bacterium]